ncbi:TadE/TadG family type IV pilus assembly protein [Trinickia sp. YCB016]
MDHKKMRWQAGSTGVETAVVFPALLLVLFGVVEAGVGVYDQKVIAQASEEAARLGAAQATAHMSPVAIMGVAQNYVSDKLITFGSSDAVKVAVDRSSGTKSGDPLTVTVSYPYNGLAVARIINALTGSLVLSAKTTTNYE